MVIRLNVYLCLKQMNAIKFKRDIITYALHTILLQIGNKSNKQKTKTKKKLFEISCEQLKKKKKKIAKRSFRAVAKMFPEQTLKIVRLLSCSVRVNNHIKSSIFYFIFVERNHVYTQTYIWTLDNVHTDKHSQSHTRSTKFSFSGVGCVFDSLQNRENACKMQTVFYFIFFFVRCPMPVFPILYHCYVVCAAQMRLKLILFCLIYIHYLPHCVNIYIFLQLSLSQK